jgi:hypothetical protein
MKNKSILIAVFTIVLLIQLTSAQVTCKNKKQYLFNSVSCRLCPTATTNGTQSESD